MFLVKKGLDVPLLVYKFSLICLQVAWCNKMVDNFEPLPPWVQDTPPTPTTPDKYSPSTLVFKKSPWAHSGWCISGPRCPDRCSKWIGLSHQRWLFTLLPLVHRNRGDCPWLYWCIWSCSGKHLKTSVLAMAKTSSPELLAFLCYLPIEGANCVV